MVSRRSVSRGTGKRPQAHRSAGLTPDNNNLRNNSASASGEALRQLGQGFHRSNSIELTCPNESKAKVTTA